jgi:hypothetical protein
MLLLVLHYVLIKYKYYIIRAEYATESISGANTRGTQYDPERVPGANVRTR